MKANRNKKGQFVSGNAGRPKGAANKLSSDRKVRIAEVLAKLEESLLQDLETMKPKEKIQLWVDLQEFIQPKLQRVAVDVAPAEEGISKITFEVVHGGSEIMK
jgi:hypothetical protein